MAKRRRKAGTVGTVRRANKVRLNKTRRFARRMVARTVAGNKKRVTAARRR